MKVQFKRMLSLLLAAATLTGLLIFPASAAGSAPFADISDPAVAEAAEVLRLLGVVSGTGGNAFNPGGVLTRAEFCKMTVEILDMGDQEPAQRNRTIFLDVGPTHWARGYINLASTVTLGGTTGEDGGSTGGTRLIMGVGNGNFEPDRKLSYGEAVTILMRVLGYGNGDVSTGANWYDGYLAIAKQAGLTDGISLSGESTVTRGQAALLFYNLLFAKSKGSSDIYLTKLGGKKIDGGILLDVNAAAADGTQGAVKTTTGTYKTDRATLSATLEGTQGDLLLDKDEKLLAFQAKKDVSRRSISVSEWQFNSLTDSNKTKLDIDPKAVIYIDGEKKVYEDVWRDQRAGAPLSIYYTAGGKVDYLFLNSAAVAETAMVAKNKPNGTSNPFGALVNRVTDYQLYKNGVPATVADIRQYDAATYDANTKVLQVSDLRLTGVYENVYPNTSTPSTITMMNQSFTVLPSAANDLKSFKIGQTITLLLTVDGQVAGVVSNETLRSNTVGVVTEIGDDGTATVEPLNHALPKLSGKSSYSGTKATQMIGQLVTVSSSSVGRINLSRLSSSGANSALDMGSGKMGNVSLAPNVTIYERVGNSKPQPVDLEDITCNTIPADKFLYVGKDYAGRISIMVLDDVTGDQYTYGFIKYVSATSSTTSSKDEDGTIHTNTEYKNANVAVENSNGASPWLTCGVQFQNGAAGGIVASLETMDGNHKLAGSVELVKVTGISYASFDMEAKTVTTPSMVLPISDDVQCYNRTTKTWFGGKDTEPMDALNLARAFSETLTIYYDKAPELGGKVRLVVAE